MSYSLYLHDLFDFVCFAVLGVLFTSVNHCVSRVKNAVSLHNASSLSSRLTQIEEKHICSKKISHCSVEPRLLIT